MRGKTPTNFVKPNCIMQLADSVSVAKIKIIYASRQRAHSEPSPLIWRSCAFNRRPMTMPVLDGVKPMAITLPICGTSESLFWKRKKSIYCWTRSRPTWTFGESDDQVQDKSETIEKRLESGLESETGLEYYSPTPNIPWRWVQYGLIFIFGWTYPLNCWNHMDYFHIVWTFLKSESSDGIDF